ncbi:MAG: septum formation initiator family protein [Actinobacteria bacterium]|nr:septum formation initiator family protein [Actinomycetota bacterium]
MAKNYSNYRKKRRKSKLRTKSRKRFRKGPNPFSILFIIIIVAVFIWSINPLSERFRKKQETLSLEQKISSVKEKNKLLEEELIRLQVDDSYYEEWARKNLFLAKPGESVYSLVGIEDKKDAVKDKSRWCDILKYTRIGIYFNPLFLEKVKEHG